jgi:IPT/TIG domain
MSRRACRTHASSTTVAMVPITMKRLLVVIASIGLLSGALSSVLTQHLGSDTRSRAAASASVPLSLDQGHNPLPGQTSCLDLPLSSQLISPESCWQTGPTSMLVVGTSPSLAGAGAIAVLQGQQRQLSVVPGSGPLSVLGANASAGCVQGARGTYYQVGLGSGAVGTVSATQCAQAEQTQGTAVGAGNGVRPVSNGVALATTVAATLIPPPVSPSYYEETSYVSECGVGATVGCPIYLQGQSTVTPTPHGIVVLDFGSPCSSGSTYGTEMFYGGGCVSDGTIRQLVQEWISGYASDHSGAGQAITLAVGTSNSYTADDASGEPANLATSGTEWFQLVVGATYNLGASAVTLWAASDMEQSNDDEWYDGSDTLEWVEGYSAAAFPSPPATICALSRGGSLADFGDDVLGGSGSGDGWTVNQIYDAAQGITGTCALPEIYYSANAPEWLALSQWAQNQGYPAMQFTAAMVEPGGTPTCPAPNGYTLLSASCAWSTLQIDTGQQPEVPAITQIATALQAPGPSVSALTPNNGPDAGGTQVVISGSGFLGTQTVYFGSLGVAVSSAAVNGAGTQITVSSPAESPGQVNVVVEAGLGASSVESFDEYQFDAPPCTADAVSLAAASVAPGFQDQATSSASCPSGANPEYTYFTRAVGAAGWTLDAAWIGPTWDWSTTGLPEGSYQLLVWVSDGPYTVPQAEAVTTLTVASQPPCTSDSANAAPNPALSGDPVQLTVSAACPAGSLPLYAYFTRPAGSGAWTLEAAWIGPTWSWPTFGLAPGTYDVLVWVSDGPYTTPQAQLAVSVAIQSLAPCSADTASAPSEVLQGAPVAIAATSACPSGSTPLYSYFVSGPDGGNWSLQAAWIGPNWSWSTLGLSPGTYQVLVWVSDGPYSVPQAQDATTVIVEPHVACSAVTVDAPSIATEGLAAVISATSTCPTAATPLYSYFVMGPGGAGWTLGAAWIGNSWSWSTVGLPDGAYQVLVWVSDGPYTIPQAQGSATISVFTQKPCTSVTAQVSPASAAAGQPESVSAVGTCPVDTQPLYSYFTGTSPIGPWSLQAAWIGPEWTWNTSGLPNGTYYVTVWVSGAQYIGPEAATVASITINTPAACTALSATAVPAAVSAGQAVVVTASSSCPPGASPLYSYFTSSPASPGVWTLDAGWIGPSWTFSTNGLTPGAYQVLVWVSDGPYTVPQLQTIQTVSVDADAACTAVSATAPATVASGQPVDVTATSSCPSGAQAEYSYFLMPPGSSDWNLQAAWIGPSWLWNTVGVSPGTYEVLVWASDGPYTVPQVQTQVAVTVTG